MKTRAIELRVVMQVEVAEELDEEQARFYPEDNHCTTNHIDDLAAAILRDDQRNVCNLCLFATVKLLAEDFPLSQAFDPKR